MCVALAGIWESLFLFLSNTYRVRHTTLRQTLADFRADNQKTKLLKILKITMSRNWKSNNISCKTP